ncbi:MAG: DUF3488 and transglutaminase-like domain-containing protein [Myxococcota bacterium]|jgi:transglutaminase-like putative cysteine protease|nr:DUF3488 and transglutaminase-like domain-containing protein [Myxococcota bacterium]
MSRLQFRASVEDPRPVAAWVMVSVAIGTLSITGQLALWAVAASATAVLFSLLHRETPRPWQKSTWFLNPAVMSIALVSMTLAWRGEPVTIALAHFAVLTQSLQLLDARARKSEFLLVALALFQVVLAANLTDSVFFPPMLIAFLAATTWTLLVHTLRSEAIEAGDTTHPDPAITRGLTRTTVLASGISILLALVIFTMLPRFRSSIVQGGGPDRRAVAGFTDEVKLGTIGKIRMDSSVVLRIETLEGKAPPPSQGYWRGLAFDHFDGERWSVTPQMRSAPGGSPTFGIDLGRAHANQPLEQRIVREPVTGGVLFGSGEARAVRGAIRRVEIDVNGSLYSPVDQAKRVRYTIRTDAHQPSDDALRRDATSAPHLRPEAYLALPAMGEAITDLASSIIRDMGSDADRVRAIETHLRSKGQYTDSPRAMDPALGDSPVEGFLLGELSGHCEYFASGMVVLLRSIGIPARLVNGFAGGQRNELGDFIEVTRADAHTWVEVHYADAGWVRYDPTPPGLRTREELPPNLVSRFAELASTVELWWYQRVVDFDTSDQVAVIRSTWLAWRALRETTSEAASVEVKRDESGALEIDASVEAIVFVGLVIALFVLIANARRPKRKRVDVPRVYGRALALLARRGLARGRATTARDFAREVTGRLPSENARAFEAITDAYLAQRFGQRPAPPLGDEWKAMRRGLPRRFAKALDQSAP